MHHLSSPSAIIMQFNKRHVWCKDAPIICQCLIGASLVWCTLYSANMWILWHSYMCASACMYAQYIFTWHLLSRFSC